MIRPKKHLAGIHRTPPERFDRTRYVRLNKNEDVTGIPEELFRIWKKQLKPDQLAAYPQLFRFYEKLGTYLSLPEDHILVTAGSDAAIKNVFEVFVSPGDKVIIPDPTYAMYEVYADLFEAALEKIPYRRDISFPIDKMIEAIDDRTRLVALANPNSPTGTIVARADILALLKKASGYDCVVLIDEAYYPFYPKTAIDLVRKYDNLIVTRTFSKAFGLAALRLGYAVARPGLISSLNTFRPIYETNGVAADLGCIVMDNRSIIDARVREIIRGRNYLIREARRLGLRPYASHSNFVNIDVGQDHVLPIVEFFEMKGILIKAGSNHPALLQCIRITAGPVDVMKQVVTYLKEYRDRSISA
jgi:histidinol-phosphate aminotransferase